MMERSEVREMRLCLKDNFDGLWAGWREKQIDRTIGRQNRSRLGGEEKVSRCNYQREDIY